MVRTLQLSREMWIFLAVTTSMSLVYLYLMTGSTAAARVKPEQITPQDLAPGKTIDAAITLITADAVRLGCASDQKLGAAHCAYGADTKPFALPEGEKVAPEQVIVPYMTVDNVLVLIPGLFTQPVLKKRLDDEPPGKYTGDEAENRRFTVTCKLKIEQKFEKFKVRWDTKQSWGDRDQAWAGTVSECKMTGG